MNPCPKTKPARFPSFLKWLLTQPSSAPQDKRDPRGEIVYAHQRAIGNCGTSSKPHDTYALPLTTYEHAAEHNGDKTFWGNINRAMLCVFHVQRYLETQGYDGWRFILDAVTERMREMGIK